MWRNSVIAFGAIKNALHLQGGMEMRGPLLATTILAGAAALGSAAAVAPAQAADAPIQLKIGGYMQGYAGWTSQDDGVGPDGVAGTADDAPGRDRRSFGFFREGEIVFEGNTTLDNGLQVGVEVQLEAVDSVDQIDQSFIWFEHSLGRVELGKNYPAPYTMWYGAPTPVDGLGINTPNILPANSTNVAGAGNLIPTPDTFVGPNKIETLNYFTPRIVGVQLGVSYSPSFCQAGNTGSNPCGGSYAGQFPDNLPQLYDLIGVGANYVNSFNGIDVGLYGGYYHGSNGAAKGAAGTPTGDNTQWGVGASLGYMGFTLGGGYRDNNDAGGVVDFDGHDWNIGLNYETGPWSFGGQYGQSEYKLLGRTDDFQGASVGGMYTLGPGVKLGLAVQYFDWGTNAANPAVSTPATNKAWNVMGGTSISF